MSLPGYQVHHIQQTHTTVVTQAVEYPKAWMVSLDLNWITIIT